MEVPKAIQRIFSGIIIFFCIVSWVFTNNSNVNHIDMMETRTMDEGSLEYWKKNSGDVSSIDGKSVFSQKNFEKAVVPKNRSKNGFVYFWETRDGSGAVSTLGSDLKHHFVQGYLSNYQPFYTDKLWIPLYTIANRKKYMFDEDQYNGFLEVWQYSKEAYFNTRGDCEDHSIVLCDWLISLGYEARVVCGSHGKEGHAWVVLYEDNQAFILEATNKRNLTMNGHYPLASILPEYRPDFMFDGEYYYEPIQRPSFRTHDKNKWRKVSKYLRNTPI